MFTSFGRPRLAPVVAAGLVLAAVTGCGKSPGGSDKLIPVQGKVMFGEKPLTTGVVIFRPDPSKGNTSQHEPRGQIDAEGNYQLRTNQKEGVAPGWYKVGVIAAPQSMDLNNPYARPQSLIPTSYNDPETSGLALAVEENAVPGAYNLQIVK
jgi:hypothetical protein